MRQHLTALGLISMLATSHPAGAAIAGALTPQDFAYRLPVSTPSEAAAHRLTLPLSVYQGTLRDDLGDLRVFNADGEIVPYALLRPAAERRLPTAAISLPLFPLHGNSRAVIDGVRLSIQATGTALNLQTRSGANDPTTGEYIVDGRSLTTPVAALTLGWSDPAAEFSGRIKIEVSEDLDLWQTLSAAAPIANLHANGRTLTENRIPVDAVRAKFWRLTWTGQPPAVEITSIAAEPAAGPVQPARTGLEVEGIQDAADPGVTVYDLAAHPPVTRVNVGLPEPNMVGSLEVSSRRTVRDVWRVVARGNVFRIKGADGEQRNPALEIGVDRDRFWRTQFSRGGTAPRMPLTLRVEWQPAELTFLARGRGPFVLSYGAAEVAPGETDLRGLPDDTRIAVAGVGPAALAGGTTKLIARPAPMPWTRIGLWGLLVVAVGLLAWMAARVWKEPPTRT